MRVKICGITRLADAQLAIELGAWALGFVFYAPSPRAIAIEQAAQIIAALPPDLLSVGVFVNANPLEINAVAAEVGLTYVQLHGDESPADCLAIERPVIKALRLRQSADLQTAFLYADCHALLIDAAVPGQWGGSGELANWELARQLVEQNQLANPQQTVILAGGLNPDNLVQAFAQVQPWALDLSSGVEQAPGLKDPQRLQQIFQRNK